MKKTINSTGRKKIPQDAVAIRVRESMEGSPRSFQVSFTDLKSLGFKPEARIYIEPYVASSSMRFGFGSVAAPKAPEDTDLREIDEGAPVLFRIKIVDEAGDFGKILGSANDVSPRGNDDSEGRKSLLPIRRTDLGEELWRLDIGRDRGPELWVNNRVAGLAERMASDSLVQGLVMPVVFRDVIVAVIDADDDAPWQEDWKTFSSKLRGEEIDWELDSEDDEDRIEDLVRALSSAFIEKQQYATRVRKAEGASEND